jgi:hypothetical protein
MLSRDTLTVGEAAEFLTVSKRTILRWIEDKYLDAEGDPQSVLYISKASVNLIAPVVKVTLSERNTSQLDSRLRQFFLRLGVRNYEKKFGLKAFAEKSAYQSPGKTL